MSETFRLSDFRYAKVLTRPFNLRRANLFTLNYDTLFEKAGFKK
jgi:hypothetical protein